MCQLTFINTKSSLTNSALLFGILFENTSGVNNKDGFGVYTRGITYRSANVPSKLLNFGTAVARGQVTRSPVLAHVRHATGHGAAKLLGKEYSHPFESEDLIFAHNGTLELNNDDDNKIFKDTKVIDSQKFLTILQQFYSEKRKGKKPGLNDIVAALKKSMEKFTGKFAFLIYEKKLNRYIAVRGKTAKLHIARLDKGYIINTDEDDLKWGIIQASNFLQISNNISIDCVGEVKELDAETIYILGQDCEKKIGEITENVKVYVCPATGHGRYSNYGWPSEYREQRQPPLITPSNNQPTLARKITQFGRRNLMNPVEIDHLLRFGIGIGLTDISSEDDDIIKEFLTEAEIYNSAKKKELWKLIDRDISTEYLYETKKIQFPYFMNGTFELENILKGLLDGVHTWI